MTSCRSTVSVAAAGKLGCERVPRELNNHVLANRLANNPRLDVWFFNRLTDEFVFGVEAPEGRLSAVEAMEPVGDVPNEVIDDMRLVGISMRVAKGVRGSTRGDVTARGELR
jgi:hypothetical protein